MASRLRFSQAVLLVLAITIHSPVVIKGQELRANQVPKERELQWSEGVRSFDPGADDAFRGYYQFNDGCRFCRWTGGDGTSGGDPTVQTQVDSKKWACRDANGGGEHSYFSNGFSHPKCNTCDADPSNADWGWGDAYKGYYKLKNSNAQTQCCHYCRWVGNSGSGGDPFVKTQHSASWWSCRIPHFSLTEDGVPSDYFNSKGFGDWEKCSSATDHTMATQAITEKLDLSGATVTLDSRFTWSQASNEAEKAAAAQKLIDGNIQPNTWYTSPWAHAPQCSAGSNAAPFVELDLGEVTLVDGVQLWHYHGDGRAYCNQAVKISEDGTNWDAVFDTGTGAGVVETATGTRIVFPAPRRIRYIRHHSGKATNTANVGAHFLEIEVYGLKLGPYTLQLSVSNDGKRLYAVQEKQLFSMDGTTRDGHWTKIEDPEAEFKAIAADDIGNVYGINDLAEVWWKVITDSTSQWSKIGDSMKHISTSADGSRIIGVSIDKKVWQSLNKATWTEVPGLVADHCSVSSNGDLIVGNEKTNGWSSVKFQGGSWVQQPPTLKNPTSLAIGGKHEVWITTLEEEVYHNWIHETEHNFKPWVKVQNKMKQVTATASGAVYGVSIDGRGVLYCPDRETTNHAFKCIYMDGPMGALTGEELMALLGTPVEAGPTVVA